MIVTEVYCCVSGEDRGIIVVQEILIDTKVRLNNGIHMPIFGLGTYQTRTGKQTEQAVLHALKAGYRLIDTAKIYGNETSVGKAIRRSGIPREEIFITTKLWNSDHGYDSTISACNESLRRIGVSYVDLYLIHWPVEGLRDQTWKGMEKLQEARKCRAIGVSNYMIWHLEELLEKSSIVPSVNQVEFSPYLYQRDLLDFCRSHQIQLEAYSPLTKGRKLNHPKLATIATGYSKSPAQILIRWALQRGVIAIPKSSKKERILENVSVFDFSILPADMEFLDSFDAQFRTSWDPTGVR